ncbi:hypothetical protein B0J14DRAFT_656103 [Halenospora varia]|nr:hypothetical protein B0J14DRAFT_656103 [Halenospora varia]
MDIVDESSKRPASSLVSEDTNPRKKHRVGTHLFSDPFSLVTFVIGSEKKQFLVHKQVACHSSEVLNAAFNGDFIEGQTQTYILNDVTDNAFTLVTQWMYFQKFDFPKLDGDSVQPHQQKIGMLLETWVVAGKLLM